LGSVPSGVFERRKHNSYKALVNYIDQRQGNDQTTTDEQAMPLYEYQCKTCGVRFERTQSFKDDPIKVCPECSGPTYRVIGATGVIFKGSGFYINDSKGKNSTGVGKKEAEGKEPVKTEASTDTKSDGSSAPAATATTPTTTSSTSDSSSTTPSAAAKAD
jgi:putative FmdB family regulatory protein